MEAGIAVSPIPGPCAAVAALSASGLPSDRFCFEGFLPARAAARRRRLVELAKETRTVILYEAPHRIAECLEDLAAACGSGRRACIARELTKRFETFYRGGLGELAGRARVDADLARGEAVILVEGATPAEPGAAELDAMLAVLLRYLPPSTAAAAAAGLSGVRRADAYARALALTKGSGTDAT